jgi:polyhydroxyalkanoate synthase
MVKPYVYDLRPEHSLVRTLRNAHFDVFVVDFGVPDRSDRETSLDDYVLDWVPRAIDEALRASGKKQVSLVGYSFGGIFALLQAGTHRDGRVKNIVTIGTPVDFTKMVTPHWMARLGALTVSPVTALLGNIPGSFSTLGFKVMGGTKSFTRWIDFVSRLYDPEYLRTFDTVNTWVNGLIPYPRDAFRQVLKDVVAGNRLVRGGLSFGGKSCDLQAITAPVLAFAGRDDNVAPLRATEAILGLVGSRDKMLVEVSGGHVAIVGGTKAPAEVWAKMVEWLTPRSR